jgi:anaphase-promoting complex subunit 1
VEALKMQVTVLFIFPIQGSQSICLFLYFFYISISMRGSCDIAVSKMLCLHIPSLIPQHFSTIDVASTVQTAAVAGAGLLYEGSCHRMMTEFLLNEIGKRPSSDGNVVDREAYTLACGIALGMVNLCKGGSHADTGAGLADLRIEDRLYRYIVGGLDDAELRRRREETDRLSLPSGVSSSNNERSSVIYEGESINIDVTAPGATLALGLMYLKSGNKTIASAIALPETHFLLEYVRPDFLMLRVIARALILWDEVTPTSEWVENQIPKAVLTAYKDIRELADSLQGGNGSAALLIEKEYDRQAVRLIYTHVVAAACFSIGLRFAGTGNMDAASIILERVNELRELRDMTHPTSAALRPPNPVLEMCLGCAAISLAMVLAGTGDLDALRLLKILRWPCSEDINYGSHLAYSTAIGLLFLGGGTCTLGREPQDIAALVMAFYPRFPSSTSDNKYHLQALRNLYALAIKNREIRAIDVDTGESVFVPIEIHFEEKSTVPLSMSAPCILLNTDKRPAEIRVVSSSHYPLSVAFDGSAGKVLFFVKRRSAYCCHGDDPSSQTSFWIHSEKLLGRSYLESIAKSTDDRSVSMFASYFCDACQPKRRTNRSNSMTKFCSRILQECLLRDTQEVVPLYVSLRRAVTLIQENCRPALLPFLWDFRLIRAYYSQNRSVWNKESILLNREVVGCMIEMIESSWATGNLGNSLHSVYYGCSFGDGCQEEKSEIKSDEMDLT